MVKEQIKLKSRHSCIWISAQICHQILVQRDCLATQTLKLKKTATSKWLVSLRKWCLAIVTNYIYKRVDLPQLATVCTVYKLVHVHKQSSHHFQFKAPKQHVSLWTLDIHSSGISGVPDLFFLFTRSTPPGLTFKGC